MPTYDYKCNGCKELFEAVHPMEHREPVVCPACDSSDTGRLILETPGVWIYWKNALASSEAGLPKWIPPAHRHRR